MAAPDKDIDVDDDFPSDSNTHAHHPKMDNSPRSGRVSSGLALIFSFVSILLTLYLWYTLIYTRPELMQLDLPRTLAELERTLGETRTSLDDADEQIATLTETQTTLKTAVDKLQADLGRNQTQWMVSEAEQLLLIASRRLQLARDVSSTIAALRAADRQLELLANPNLLPVRREIAREISVLEGLERTDVAGISLRLGALADGIDQLPLAPDMRMTAEQKASAQIADATASQQTSPSAWRDLLSLVRIRRHENAPRPPLPPEQQYYARENFRLMLYGAQHALLQGNAATYQQNMKSASRWVGDYFDRDATAVTAVRAELEKLAATPVMGELPDITPSLELLRKASGRRAAS